MLLACECDARGRLGFEQRDYPQRARLLQALAFARSVDTAAVAQRCAALGQAGPQIGEAIHAARIEALRQGFADDGMNPPTMPPSPVEAAPRELGRPLAGWRLRLYTIIFEADTRAGRAFDLTLIGFILASVAVVVLDSVAAVHQQHGGWLKGLEWFFTLAFTVEYIAAAGLRAPSAGATRAASSASSTCWPSCPPTWRCWCRRCTR